MTAKNIIPQIHKINKGNRNNLTGNKSFVVWFTGLSGSGKSTLADKLEQKLFSEKILTFILDGDNIRAGLNRDLGFGEADRRENIRRLGEVCRLMVDAGVIVLTAFISPFKDDRKTVRDLMDRDEFIEIYVKCPLEVCEERDVKGLYGKARSGEIKNFTGIDSPYEEPDKPELVIDTSKNTVDESSEIIFNFIRTKLSL